MPDRFSMARETRSVLLAYYADFMEVEFEPHGEGSRFVPDLVARYVWFEAYIRNLIGESNPGLNDLNSLGRLDALVRRVLPDFHQFIGIVAVYHGWDLVSPLDKPPVHARSTGTSPRTTSVNGTSPPSTSLDVIPTTTSTGLGFVKGKGASR